MMNEKRVNGSRLVNYARGAIKSFLVVSYETVLGWVLLLPRYRTLNRLKAGVLRAAGARVGKRVVFYPGVWIMPATGLSLGDDVDLAKDVTITGRGPVTVGDRTLVGYGARIISSNHLVPEVGRIFDAGHSHEAVTIGRDAWIGANALILPGVEVGEGAVVAAGAVVTRDVIPFSIVAGVPARAIALRGSR